MALALCHPSLPCHYQRYALFILFIHSDHRKGVGTAAGSSLSNSLSVRNLTREIKLFQKTTTKKKKEKENGNKKKR